LQSDEFIEAELEDEEATLEEKATDEATYPESILSTDQINTPVGFVVYLAIIMYAFLGISLVT